MLFAWISVMNCIKFRLLCPTVKIVWFYFNCSGVWKINQIQIQTLNSMLEILNNKVKSNKLIVITCIGCKHAKERMDNLKKSLYTRLWAIFYVILVFLPLVLLIIFPRPRSREFLRDFSVALGFITMSLLGLQTIPTSRLKFITRHFPMEKLDMIHHKCQSPHWLSVIHSCIIDY